MKVTPPSSDGDVKVRKPEREMEREHVLKEHSVTTHDSGVEEIPRMREPSR